MTSPDPVRAQVRAWLAEHWDPDLALAEWRERLADSGWGAPSWPREWYGRGLPAALDGVVAAEFARAGAVGPPPGAGMGLAAPTLLEHADDALKRALLRPILTGEHLWCQLFSEPGSGSDLASLTTSARPDGDGWLVNGQKVWTTSAHHAHYGMLLARTNRDAAKHHGITFFALPMQQPGVEVRPLRQMNGHASFNEVFLTDARVPAGHVIGAIDGGWPVALTTLAHERRLAVTRPFSAGSGGAGRAQREAAAEAARWFEPYRWYPQRAGRVDLLVPQLLASGRRDDPLLRQELAAVLTLARAAEATAARARAARAAGRPPGPEGSIAKLLSSRVAKAAAALHARIAGPDAMLAGADAPLDGLVTEVLLSVPAVSIAGGTDEIQRSIVAERVLGLPKEPRPAGPTGPT